MDANDVNQMPDRERAYDRMLNMMNANSSFLQSYRSIFATVQTVLVAIGIYVISFPDFRLWIGIPLAIVGTSLSRVWWFTCKIRAHDERYFSWQILLMEGGGEPPTRLMTELEVWRDNSEKDKLVRLRADIRTWLPEPEFDREKWLNLGFPNPRWWMDVGLPLLFSGMWFILVIITLILWRLSVPQPLVGL